MIQLVVTDLTTGKNTKVVVMDESGGKIEMTDREARKSFPDMMKGFDMMETLYNCCGKDN